MRTLLPGLFVVLQLGGSSPLVAQQDRLATEPPRVWVTGGLGGSTEGFAGALGLDLLVEQHLISFRSAAVANILDDEFWDLAVLYGRARRGPRGMMLAASTGLA